MNEHINTKQIRKLTVIKEINDSVHLNVADTLLKRQPFKLGCNRM